MAGGNLPRIWEIRWLLQSEYQHNELLRPVAALQEIVGFEQPFVRPIRQPFEHTVGVKIPHGSPAHHVQTQRPENDKIHCSVHLLHEPILYEGNGSMVAIVP